ncbi:MAG: glycosyltransferase family 2 protein [Anaerolineaceae bacterium]|jgi:glycosyltransferase involved in cell wall biosynthesis|nr:glycosyltransferase family 2 protein [Anaerolineaceae bacterium]
MNLSIIIPVFNEVQTIADIVERVVAVPLEKEIILVDDGSSDGSADVVESLISGQIKAFHHKVNRGKGAAILTGFEAAAGEVFVVQDADLEYDPQDFIRLIEPIKTGSADVVYGVRSLGSQKPVMRWGNQFVTWITNLLYGQHLKDMETCYKMMRREIALSLDLECRGFDVEAEITAKILRSGFSIHELPISYNARYDNKKLTPLDGLPTTRALWKYRRWNPAE